MTDQEFESIKDKVQSAFKKWCGLLGLKWWRDVTVYYHRESFSIEENGHPPDCVGFVNCDWSYKDAAVHFSVAKLWKSEATDEEIDYYVRHELCHCLVHQMREWKHWNPDNPQASMVHEEAVVTNLAQAFGWAYNHTGEEENEDQNQEAAA